ncbi:MAG: restriction endonuclease [Nostoc sp.]
MSSLLEPQFIQDFTHFEQHVAKLIHKAGWTVETAKTNQPGYDLVAKKGNLVVVVQVKWLKGNVTAPQLLKFADFLDSDEGKKFNFGWFITTKGFGGPASALIRTWGKDTKVRCGIAHENKLVAIDGNFDDTSNPNPNEGTTPKKVYFGVFTCKGGVGKTTVAGHLAGALALQGFNVALVDLDPEKNLQKLVGDGIFVPNPKGVGTTIQVFDGKDWNEDSARDCQIVICDCSPALERNPPELVKRLASRLAFDLVGGRCYPREDFINLADYIERKAGIGILRAN